ncbi:hypothetical protein HDV06_005981 [Boothiomyces sp. JEL0866]|nr:hypothetical protein HDV06_005981 [Boothiomyces sp. JEL0866]
MYIRGLPAIPTPEVLSISLIPTSTVNIPVTTSNINSISLQTVVSQTSIAQVSAFPSNIPANDLPDAHTSNPITANPATANPITANPATANPITANPATANPATANPITANPSAVNSSSVNQPGPKDPGNPNNGVNNPTNPPPVNQNPAPVGATNGQTSQSPGDTRVGGNPTDNPSTTTSAVVLQPSSTIVQPSGPIISVGPISPATFTSFPTDTAANSNGSSSNLLPVVLPIILVSLLVVALAIFGFVYYKKGNSDKQERFAIESDEGSFVSGGSDEFTSQPPALASSHSILANEITSFPQAQTSNRNSVPISDMLMKFPHLERLYTDQSKRRSMSSSSPQVVQNGGYNNRFSVISGGDLQSHTGSLHGADLQTGRKPHPLSVAFSDFSVMSDLTDLESNPYK